jgi:hypothetical protein
MRVAHCESCGQQLLDIDYYCAPRTSNRTSRCVPLRTVHKRSTMKGLPRTQRSHCVHTALLLLIFFVAGAQAHWSQHYRYTHNAQSDFTGKFLRALYSHFFSFPASVHFFWEGQCVSYNIPRRVWVHTILVLCARMPHGYLLCRT